MPIPANMAALISAVGHLGWIPPSRRTQAQQDAHSRALATLPKLTVAGFKDPGNAKVILTDFWKQPDVVADVGFEFTGFRQLTGSCFPAGTPVRMADGSEKPIEAVAIGDEVISHTGTPRRVVETMRRSFSGDMVTLHVAGFPFPLEMTADHQVATAPLWRDGEPEWKRADEIEESDRVLIGWGRKESAPQSLDMAALLGGDCIILDELMKEGAYTKGNEPDVPNSNFSSARHMVRRSGIDWTGRVRLHRSRVENSIFRHVPVCPSLGRLIGLYLAEGGCDAGRVVFTFHVKEKETLAAEVLALVRGLFRVEGEIVSQPSRPNNCTVRFGNQNLAAVFKALMPGGVYTKRVPGLFFGASEETRLAVLLGWMAGDGYVGVKNDRLKNVRITGVTVCAGLARDMTTLALSCGLRATCGRRKARNQSKVSYGVDLAGRKAVRLFPAVAHRAEGWRYSDTDSAQTKYGFARAVRTVERRPVEMLPVFDFEVEKDHSFLAGGLTVHNCVGVSSGNAVFTLGAIQRTLADNPTKAFVPWWPFPYGRTRYNEGDRGQGEGAVDSVMAHTLLTEGVFAYTEATGLPTFDKSDGLAITNRQELQYSDGAASVNTQYLPLAKQHLVGAAATINDVAGIRAAILNGYPVLDGCEDYIGNGSLSGDVALGNYDGRGGHSTCYLGVWDHPQQGPLYLYSNQWAGSTYPADSSGRGRCTVWVKESNVARLFQLGGNQGETVALSHLSYFPSQPSVLDWSRAA